MKKELELELVKKYPTMFKEYGGDKTKTCMHWGMTHGDGWYNILDILCAAIASYEKNLIEQNQRNIEWNININNKEWVKKFKEGRDDEFTNSLLKPREVKKDYVRVVFQQIKEKFGELRIYYIGGDDYIDGLIIFASLISSITCEECGMPGKIKGKIWLKCTCDKCEKELLK